MTTESRSQSPSHLDSELRTLIRASLPLPPRHQSRVSPEAIRRQVRHRRAVRHRLRSVALTLLAVVALGAGGRLLEGSPDAVDVADDALLRSLEVYREAPDIGGLGSLVWAGIEEDA